MVKTVAGLRGQVEIPAQVWEDHLPSLLRHEEEGRWRDQEMLMK